MYRKPANTRTIEKARKCKSFSSLQPCCLPIARVMMQCIAFRGLRPNPRFVPYCENSLNTGGNGEEYAGHYIVIIAFACANRINLPFARRTTVLRYRVD